MKRRYFVHIVQQCKNRIPIVQLQNRVQLFIIRYGQITQSLFKQNACAVVCIYRDSDIRFLCAAVEERKKKMNIEINGVTLQADFMDADFMEKFEPAINKTREEINAGKAMQGMTAAKYKTPLP